jgi:hypothetical protein
MSSSSMGLSVVERLTDRPGPKLRIPLRLTARTGRGLIVVPKMITSGQERTLTSRSGDPCQLTY